MYIKVLVTAGAKKEVLTKSGPLRFKISVTEPAQQNLANKKVLALIAKHFGVTNKKVRIVSGHHSPSKMLSVEIE